MTYRTGKPLRLAIWRRINASIIGVGIGICCIPVEASAQAAAEENVEGLETIIVTARKVAENQQDVPVAVTVQTGEALEKQNAVRIQDIARLSPGLVLAPSTSQPSGLVLTVRGQVQTDVLATLDPSVGTYVDGVYWARAHGLNADLLDVQNAQVLRGPQGTLFGRNTTGGALLIQTNDPSYDGISGRLSATYGRFEERTGTAVLNVPLIADKVAVRGAFTINKRDGIFTNTLTGSKLGDRDSYAGRVKLLVNPTSNLSLLFSAEFFHTDTLSPPFQLKYVSPSSPANTEAALEANPANAVLLATPAGRAQLTATGQSIFTNYINSVAGSDNVALNSDPVNFAKTQTYSGTATLDTFFGAIKLIGGYRKVEAHNNYDLDGSPVQLVETAALEDLHSYSGELQITGTAFGDAVDFASGLFIFSESGRDQSITTSLPVVSRVSGGGVLRKSFFAGDITTRSMGMYAQGTLHVSDQFSVVGGLRYSVEDKNLVSFNQTLNADTNVPVACQITGAGGPVLPDCRIEARDSFSGISYTVGLNYQLAEDVLVYAKLSKGFRSGGQQLRATGPVELSFVPFRPEVAKEIEVGLKSEFFDRRLRFNLAAYYNKVSDIQRTTINVNPQTLTSATVLSNAGKARFMGGEAELTALLFDGFTLSGTLALTDPKYLVYSDPAGDRRDELFQQVTKSTFSLAAAYERDLGAANLNANLAYAWQGKTPLYAVRSLLTGNAAADEVTLAIIAATERKAGGELNGRLAVSIMDDALELAVFGRNILNRRTPNVGLVFGAPLNVATTRRNDPATYGVSLTYRFGGS